MKRNVWEIAYIVWIVVVVGLMLFWPARAAEDAERTENHTEITPAVIRQETEFRNGVGDDGRSVGYMQVQRRWHEDRMARLGVTDLTDPYGNFRVGCDYLAELLGKYPLEEALTAYNSGKPGKSAYASNVLAYMEAYYGD